MCLWLSHFVYVHGRVCIFRLGSSFETRFLFLNIKPKSVWQMVLELAVLSLSCALLKRLVCPTHPTMPWRYQHFVVWLSSHHRFSTQRFCLPSLRHPCQSKVLFLRPSRDFWFQLSLASEAPLLLSHGQRLHAPINLSRGLCVSNLSSRHTTARLNRALELKWPPPALLPKVCSTDSILSTPKPLPFQLKMLHCITSDSKEKETLSFLFSKHTLVFSASFVHVRS